MWEIYNKNSYLLPTSYLPTCLFVYRHIMRAHEIIIMMMMGGERMMMERGG